MQARGQLWERRVKRWRASWPISLYAELYGVGRNPSASALPEAKRRPLFDYYHGRSRLATWLRAILAQRYVDRWRASARLAPEKEAAQPTRALHKNSAGARPELSADAHATRSSFRSVVRPHW